MTTLESSSSATESGHTSMGDNSQDYQQQQQLKRKNVLHLSGRGGRKGDEDGDDYRDVDGGGDDDVMRQQVWETFSNRFQQVQTVLDQNRVLIAQVNENHQSKLPDNLSKNVSLIREINTNVAKVVSLYSDLSSTFSDIFLQSRSSSDADTNPTNDNIGDSNKA